MSDYEALSETEQTIAWILFTLGALVGFSVVEMQNVDNTCIADISTILNSVYHGYRFYERYNATDSDLDLVWALVYTGVVVDKVQTIDTVCANIVDDLNDYLAQGIAWLNEQYNPQSSNSVQSSAHFAMDLYSIGSLGHSLDEVKPSEILQKVQMPVVMESTAESDPIGYYYPAVIKIL